MFLCVVPIFFFFLNYILDPIDVNELNFEDGFNKELSNVNKSNENVMENDVNASGIIFN